MAHDSAGPRQDIVVPAFPRGGKKYRLEAEYPDKKFIWPFGVCSYMKKNTLENTLEALVDPRPEQLVEVAPELAAAAKKSIDKMFELAQ